VVENWDAKADRLAWSGHRFAINPWCNIILIKYCISLRALSRPSVIVKTLRKTVTGGFAGGVMIGDDVSLRDRRGGVRGGVKLCAIVVSVVLVIL
jgi:hypothetical protein